MGFEKPDSKKEFERSMRSEARQRGEESTLYSHEAVAAREVYDAQAEYHADERNAHRNIFHKLLGLKKTRAEDIVREEADRLNALVDEKVARDRGFTTHQEAADEIAQSSEFESPTAPGSAELFQNGKDNLFLHKKVDALKDKIEFREFLRDEDPALEEELDKGNAEPVVEFINEIKHDMDHKSASFYHQSLQNLIGDKLESLAAAGNSDAVRRIIATAASSGYVSPDKLAAVGLRDPSQS